MGVSGFFFKVCNIFFCKYQFFCYCDVRMMLGDNLLVLNSEFFCILLVDILNVI